MLAYKVVEKVTRKGSGWMLAKKEAQAYRVPFPLKIMEKHKKFYPTYYKGRTIKAVPGSEGIYCFQTDEDASYFVSYYGLEGQARIIRVEGIGEPSMRPHYIPRTGTVKKIENLISLYSLDHTYYRFLHLCLWAKGAVCFGTVRVLD